MKQPKLHLRRGAAALLLCALLFSLPTAQLYADDTSSLPEESQAEQEPVIEAVEGSLYQPTSFNVEASGVYLLNLESGIAIFEKNADTQYTAASLVKLMSAILVMENIPDIDGTQITAETWVFDYLYGKNASHADIRPGETLSVRELLYAMLLPSANEAALMVAGYVGGGSYDSFVEMMNNKAAALGCTNTVFTDPNGLDEGNKTSARDMAIIMAEFMKYDELMGIAGSASYEIAAHEKHSESYYVTTTNRLIVSTSPYYSLFNGAGATVQVGKTGSLGEWQNFAAYAKKDDMSYIIVMLDSPNSEEGDPLAVEIAAASRPALYQTAQLLNWAYSEFSIRGVLDTTKAIDEIPVKYSTDDDAVKVIPAQDLKSILRNDADESVIVKTYDKPEYVEAPIRQGDVLGTVTVSMGGRVIGTADLIAAKDVERNQTLYTIEQVKAFFGTIWFKLIIVGVVVLVGVYIALAVYFNKKKKRSRNPYTEPKKRK